MKHILILIALYAAACGKEDIQSPQTCGYVFDKFFSDSTGRERWYHLWMTSDTIIPIPPAPPNQQWVIKVDSATYFSMLAPGQPYPPRYCY